MCRMVMCGHTADSCCSGNRLATKTADGRMAVYSMPSGAFISSWRVPGCSSATASYSSRCSFGHTQDGQYIAVGEYTGHSCMLSMSRHQVHIKSDLASVVVVVGNHLQAT